MFGPLRSEIDARFHELQSFFAASRGFRGDLAATAKGLAFVQVYAAYEFTVRGVVEAAIDSINVHGHRMREMAPCLMTLYLDNELKSLRDSGRTKVWDARLALFERPFPMTLLPSRTMLAPQQTVRITAIRNY
jgi:hypothetical protein